MGAQTADRVVAKVGSDPILRLLPVGVAATKKIYANAMVTLNSSGYLTNQLATDPAAAPIGVSRGPTTGTASTADNTNGADGDITVQVERGVFPLANSASTDAITIADIGRLCYVVDDQTVARTWGTTAVRPVAGRVYGLNAAGQVLVQIGVEARESVEDILVPAGADLSALQNTFVALDTSQTVPKAIAASAAGQDCAGVLLNAPTSGQIAIIRKRGRCLVTGSAAINPGVLLGTTSAGKSVAATTMRVDTSDAGAANDPVKGSFVLARCLGLAANNALHAVYVLCDGAGEIQTAI